jgi:hypothetical protein
MNKLLHVLAKFAPEFAALTHEIAGFKSLFSLPTQRNAAGNQPLPTGRAVFGSILHSPPSFLALFHPAPPSRAFGNAPARL